MHYSNAAALEAIAHASPDNEESLTQIAQQAASDLNKTQENNALQAGQSLAQSPGRKGQVHLNSSRPNTLHQTNFLNSKSVIASQQPDQVAPAGKSAPGVVRLPNQSWIQGPDYGDATPAWTGVNDQNSAAQKSQSQQKQREANMQSRNEEDPDDPPQSNPMAPAETTNLPAAHQNP